MFVGITTAPRKEPTVLHTIKSVQECGYEPVVFAEPRSLSLPVKTIKNSTRLGVWRNWLALCFHALENTAEDIIVTLQDDIDLHPDTLSFVEKHKGSIRGLLSLYTSRFYGKTLGPGVHHVKTENLWGACALAFQRDTLLTLLNHTITTGWTRDHGQDIVVGRVMNDLSLPMHFISPSPAAHISRFSATGHGSNEGNRNCYKQADKKLSLEEQIWPS